MRILHYLLGLPPVRGGGMIKYTLDLVEGEEKLGHDVCILVPGEFTHFYGNDTRIIEKKWKKVTCYNVLNPLPVSMGKKMNDIQLLWQEGNEDIYKGFLVKVRPEIIHVHSFMGLHSSFLKAAWQMDIPIVYTTHDYYGICPKILLLKGTEQCTMTNGRQCPSCFEESISLKKLVWEQSALYRMLKSNILVNWLEHSWGWNFLKRHYRSFLGKSETGKMVLNEKKDKDISQMREYQKLQDHYKKMFLYVTRFHFNCTQSKDIYIQYLGNISGNVISIRNKSIADRRVRREYGEILRIGFIGHGMFKGFNLLKEALDNLYAGGMRDIECHVYFKPKEKMPPYIISHRPYRDETADKVYNGMDVLVLPSVWKETFGMVVLEALSYGVPVIISENVGAKELLIGNDKMGMVIKPERESLQTALAEIYRDRELLRQMNLAICNWAMDFDYGHHVRKILDMYESIKKA